MSSPKKHNVFLFSVLLDKLEHADISEYCLLPVILLWVLSQSFFSFLSFFQNPSFVGEEREQIV